MRPAACVTDIHVYPIATLGTPVVRHVGDPVNLGSPNILIGG